MKALIGFAFAAALAFSASVADARGTQNNLKQLALGVVLYEVDFFTPFPAVVDQADMDSVVLKVRKSRCGDDCGMVDVTYFTLAAGGGLSVADETGGLLFSAFGEQLFTGLTARPTFRLGDFTFSSDRSGGAIDAVLRVTPVPEPAGWALLIAGFGLTGVALRRRGRAERAMVVATVDPRRPFRR